MEKISVGSGVEERSSDI